MLLGEVLKSSGEGWLLSSGVLLCPECQHEKVSEVLMLVSRVPFGKLRPFLLTFVLYSEFLSVRISDIIIIC